MKFLTLIVAGLALSTPSVAQVRYGGMQQFGISFNENGNELHLAVVNGVRFNRFFAGIGANPRLESNAFRYHTAALYADGRYYAGKSRQFFAKGNAGVNLITGKMSDSWGWNWSPVQYTYSRQPGLYAAIGAGVKARLVNDIFYSFDICYSFLQMRYSGRYTNFLGEMQTDRFDVRQTAIVLQLGFEIM